MSHNFFGGLIQRIVKAQTSFTPTAWDPLKKESTIQLSNLNRTAFFPNTGTSNFGSVGSVGGRSAGKFYWEVTFDQSSEDQNTIGIGIVRDGINWETQHVNDRNVYYSALNGGKNINGTSTPYGDSYGPGDIVGIALDIDLGAVWFSKNGTWQAGATINEIETGVTTNAAYAGLLAGVYYAYLGHGSVNDGTMTLTANFGATPFTFTVPEGFAAGFGPPA